ncbi:MOSC domain-containing protein [Paraliobacillus zengyii]|uniref:MOSC domain-containing protein n=1 Tax=Paraliobacillus zengyii TaxID=2213194 RepID=UPI000DD43729|nr:MOSC domain-containing protein [Paraliobacillus zengyii]
MKYQIVSLNIGQPKVRELQGKMVETGFIKERVTESIWLSKTGFNGDGQADLKNHGGLDKAILLYPYDHYAFWEGKYNRKFNIPAFGENLTIEGLTEETVYIGDEFELGEAIIQVSQPRQPCFKIAGVHQLKDITALVTETGYGGYYCRVIKEGYVSSKDTLKFKKKYKREFSIKSVHNLLFHDRENQHAMKELLQVDSLANSVKRTLSKRIK